MRRVSLPLVMSNTIFDMTRKGKTLLVMPNIHCVQCGNDATHCSNNTSPPSPPSLEMQDGGGCISFYFLQPVPSLTQTLPTVVTCAANNTSPPSLA